MGAHSLGDHFRVHTMSGLDSELVVHHLAIDPKVKLVKQELQKMYPKVTLLVKVELERMLDVKVI